MTTTARHYSSQARTRQIKVIAYRAFLTLLAFLFVTFYAPLFALAGAALAHWTVGLTLEQGNAWISTGCRIGHAVYGYGLFCGAL